MPARLDGTHCSGHSHQPVIIGPSPQGRGQRTCRLLLEVTSRSYSCLGRGWGRGQTSGSITSSSCHQPDSLVSVVDEVHEKKTGQAKDKGTGFGDHSGVAVQCNTHVL